MVPMGVPVGWGHLVHPQGVGHSVLKGPGRGACLAFSFSLSFLSFSPCFSSSPAVNKSRCFKTSHCHWQSRLNKFGYTMYMYNAPFSSFLGQKIHGYLPAWIQNPLQLLWHHQLDKNKYKWVLIYESGQERERSYLLPPRWKTNVV